VERVNDRILQLTLPSDSGVSSLLTSDKIRQLEASLEEHFGRRMKLRLATDPETAVKQPAMTVDPRFDLAPEDLLRQNPEIREIVEKYDGKITSIRKIDTGGADNG
jgi:hypothetical protein